MSTTTSVSTPLMERVVCGKCGHFHRAVLRDKCACCGDDVRRTELTANRDAIVAEVSS